MSVHEDYTSDIPHSANYVIAVIDSHEEAQRATDALQQGGPTAEAIAQNLLDHLRRFVGNAKRTDDVTMIVAKVGQ